MHFAVDFHFPLSNTEIYCLHTVLVVSFISHYALLMAFLYVPLPLSLSRCDCFSSCSDKRHKEPCQNCLRLPYPCLSHGRRPRWGISEFLNCNGNRPGVVNIRSLNCLQILQMYLKQWWKSARKNTTRQKALQSEGRRASATHAHTSLSESWPFSLNATCTWIRSAQNSLSPHSLRHSWTAVPRRISRNKT